MKRYRFFLLTLLLALLPLQLPAITVDNIPNVHRQDARRFVSNPDGVLSDAAVARVDAMLRQLMDKTTAEVVVIAVDEADPSMTPHEMAYAIQSKWGVGKSDRNNGLVMLVSRGDRRVEIITGRGLEGIIPDVVAGRIINRIIIPEFKKGDLDTGVEKGVAALSAIIANPDNADEVLSSERNDAIEAPVSADDIWNAYLGFASILCLIMVIGVIYLFRSTRRLPLAQRYRKVESYSTLLLIAGFMTLGAGLFIYFIYRLRLRSMRNHTRKCGRCGHKMKKMSEERDNDYLSPSQDLEEQLKSVDYDVWVCPECHEVDIIPFINRHSSYRECPKCHARAAVLTMERHLRPATTRSEGAGERIYTCRNCGHNDREIYRLPKLADDSAVAAGAAGAILGSMLGGSRGGGGGFSGGSFGGGSSAGGGAGGSW